MYEATVLKYSLKNTYGCDTVVIEYKYRYSYNHQALSLLYYRRNGRRIFFKIKPHSITYTLYDMKVLSQLFFVIIRSHNRGVQSGIPSI